MRVLVAVSLLGLFALAAGTPVESCCMVPATYKGTISQSAQEAVLFHADGREELVLKINYKITGDTLPDKFAWVITVPNTPDAYEVADVKLFPELFPWAEKLVVPPSKGRDKGRDNGGDDKKGRGHGLQIGKPVKVGPYTIQPVKALGKEALTGLNDWLGDNGFPKEDPDHMVYFVENKFTFLCVKFAPPKGQKTVNADGGVPPLHLSFKSDSPYYPLRFSSRQGVFDVNLYVFTKKDFDYKSSKGSLDRINVIEEGPYLTNVQVAPEDFPKPLKAVYEKSKFKDYAGKWRLNVLWGKDVNKGNSIANWKTDIFFKTKA
jgi:hypothetical protein